FLFALLASVTVSAQVTHVEPVGANYATQTVSFRVWWNAGSRDATHLSKVWVWVDYIQVNANNTTSGNTWTRATVGTVSGGTTSFDGSNRNGFWLEGNASTNYSTTLAVQLTNVPAKFNWCAYASDYPPNMVMDEEIYYFKGTPPFILKGTDGIIREITQTSIPKSSLTFTPVSITDKTECPGGLKEVIGTCPYTGTDWYADPNHKCQQRTSGAQNWEAHIKDRNDNKVYRIVQFSDNSWWFDQDYATSTKLYATCINGTMPYYKLSDPPSCSNGWSFPTATQIAARWPVGKSDTYGSSIENGYDFYENGTCVNGGDCWGFLIAAGCKRGLHFYEAEQAWLFRGKGNCNEVFNLTEGGRIRCRRQL
ncbi:MAG: hypothetical protein LBF81_03630, partial [Prevotellaceae bacterium]|nr:hypothetical protein [Prevotellaceae bacterium]